MSAQYYSPSGKFTVLGAVKALLVSLAVAAVLGAVYAAGVWYMPFVYFNFLLCFGLALLTSVGVSMAIKGQHIRNATVVLFIGLLAGIAAEYVQWVVYSSAFLFPDVSLMTILSSPLQLFDTLMDVSDEGIWSIKGKTVSGGTLLTVWGIEAFIVVMGTAALSRMGAGDPYSEKCGKWMEKEEQPCALALPADVPALLEAVKGGSMEGLLQADMAEAGEPALTLTLFSCDGDEVAYVTVQQVTPKGKDKKTTTTLLEHLQITQEQLAALHARMQELAGNEQSESGSEDAAAGAQNAAD